MDEYDPERDRDGNIVAWASVRSDYEAGLLTCNGIAHRYRLRRGQLDQRARASKWVRPGSSEALDRQLLIARLLGLLERQMEIVEAEMDKGNRAESKVLSDLVRDLDKLIALERAEARPAGSPRNPGEASELRRKLEERINAITKGMV
ncbi:hypothetical protein [Devosia sp. CAU 1758]